MIISVFKIAIQLMSAKITSSKYRVSSSSYIQNLSIGQIIRSSYATVKAIKEYRKIHGKRCRWCSTDKMVQIHHIVPIWKDPSIAANKGNLIPLCRRCHLVVGHAGSWTGRYVKNIVHLCELRNVICRNEQEQFDF